MEPRDTAFINFQKFRATLTPEYWASIKTEADTRMKIIDKLFVDVLGWPTAQIFLESAVGDGFLDYRFTVDGLNRLIVEAKKESRDFGIINTHAGRYFQLDGSAYKGKDITEGINQAIGYCSRKGAELACVTNGQQWLVFRGNRLGDGKDVAEGQGCCFGSLDAVEEKFNLFFDLLSYDAVSNFTFRGLFQEAEGRPLRSTSFCSSPRAPESRQFIQTDKLYSDLDRIMLSFFQDLHGDDDPDARKACFVITKESAAAEESLARISEELRGKVQHLATNEGYEIAEAIRRVQEMHRKELVLLVGTKGAGKSTFIDRFFGDYLPKDIADDCVVVRIDLASCERDHTTILKWLDEKFLEACESAAFKGKTPEWDDIVGMFFTEYKRLSEGPLKHLYDTDKTQFKIDFGKHIERRREERPHDYIVNLLHRIVNAHKKVPCLVFDNADHFDVAFQEEVFKFAHSLYRECLSLVIVPITDTTSWQLSKQGALQSFHTESFYLPTPPTEDILSRRIEYIEEKIKLEKPEKGKGYFFGKGIPLTIDNIKAFAACLQAVFLKTPHVANWIGSLSNRDVRRSLRLSREIVTSPHIDVEQLLSSYMRGSVMAVPEDCIKLAMIKGKYDIYPVGHNSFVQNVFNLSGGNETSPLLGMRVLQVLKDIHVANPNSDARYMLLDDLVAHMLALGVQSHILRKCIQLLLKTGLVLSYDPTTTDLSASTKIEISSSGRQHLLWSTKDWTYLECMAEVTPLFNEDTAKKILALLKEGGALHRRTAIRSFLEYLLVEDASYCVIPRADQFESQLKIRNLLSTQISALSSSPFSTDGRYGRQIGTIRTWNADKGFGFLKLDTGEDLFLHVEDIIDPPKYIPSLGDKFELEEGMNAEGKSRALHAVKKSA